MLYEESRMDKVSIYRERKRVKDVCEKLDQFTKSKLNIDTEFKFYGGKEEGSYTIHNSKECSDIDLSLSLYYPEKSSFFYDKGTKDLEDKEFEMYIESKNNKSKLLYAVIEWFSVKSKGNGIGSKLVVELIETLKCVDTIEFILLHPKNNDAKRFWQKNMFIETIEVKYDKRINSQVFDELMYKY